MTSPAHPGLSHYEVLALGGWHRDYARVLITASDGDYGFALVDGNGDGAELEEELWRWEDGRKVVTIEFEQHRYELPAPLGIWGFMKVAAAPRRCGPPVLVS